MILRQFPVHGFAEFQAGGNMFSTTITVLASALLKIQRVTKLPVGMELYRGLGGKMDLPPQFWRLDEHGCRGLLEHGFMSTSSSKATALEYSGVREEGTRAMVTAPNPHRSKEFLRIFERIFADFCGFNSEGR